MANAKTALAKLEQAIQQYDGTFGILLVLATTDERGSNIYESLVSIEEGVGVLNDPRLSQLYQRLLDGHRNFIPKYRQVLDADYKAFWDRLAKLGQEAGETISASVAELKETLA